MDRKRIFEKVAKCFALAHSKGAAPNEAETALRQARKLMEQYNLDDREVKAFLVNEHCIPTGTRRQPPTWIFALANTCATAFDCEYLAFPVPREGWSLKFVGLGVSPELAAYAYSALNLQLQSARRHHVAQQHRCKLSTKRRRGAIFAEAWISAVAEKVWEFAQGRSTETEQAIQAYLERHHPGLKTNDLDSTQAKGHDQKSQRQGWEQGRKARLNPALRQDAPAQPLLGGGAW